MLYLRRLTDRDEVVAGHDDGEDGCDEDVDQAQVADPCPETSMVEVSPDVVDEVD